MPKTIKEYVSPRHQKEAQQVTADIVHVAFGSHYSREVVHLNNVSANQL